MRKSAHGQLLWNILATRLDTATALIGASNLSKALILVPTRERLKGGCMVSKIKVKIRTFDPVKLVEVWTILLSGRFELDL